MISWELNDPMRFLLRLVACLCCLLLPRRKSRVPQLRLLYWLLGFSVVVLIAMEGLVPHHGITAHWTLLLILVAIKESLWGLSSTIRLRFEQSKFRRLRSHHRVDDVCKISWDETWHPVGLWRCETLGDQRRLAWLCLLLLSVHLRDRGFHTLRVIMINADSRRSRLIAALCVGPLPSYAASGLLRASTGRPTPLAESIASIPLLEHDQLLPHHVLEVILLLLYPSLHLVDPFPQLADVILDLTLEKLIYLRNELLLIGRDSVLLLFHLLVV